MYVSRYFCWRWNGFDLWTFCFDLSASANLHIVLLYKYDTRTCEADFKTKRQVSGVRSFSSSFEISDRIRFHVCLWWVWSLDFNVNVWKLLFYFRCISEVPLLEILYSICVLRLSEPAFVCLFFRQSCVIIDGKKKGRDCICLKLLLKYPKALLEINSNSENLQQASFENKKWPECHVELYWAFKIWRET